MNKLMLGFLLFIVATSSVFAAQGSIHLPRECVIQRSAQSDNFILFWGPEVTDPLTHPTLSFDPQRILNDAEGYYETYVNQLNFVNPADYNDFKLIIIMNETWGPSIYTGWAFGGAENGAGAIYVHPNAARGQTLAHELTHALQTYTGGFVRDSYVGFFWETHANFMPMQIYTTTIPDFVRFLNTSHYHWSSTRHHYVNWQFLQYIKDADGMQLINRMWNEQRRGEHPVEVYKRLKGIDQEGLNDNFGEYAFKNVKWDYSNKSDLVGAINRINDRYMHRYTIVPEAVNVETGDFKIQDNLAPQDYGYNIIRLYPQTHFENDKRFVWLKFRGQSETAPNAGWRYGFVASDAQGQTRYSPMYSDSQGEVLFELEAGETEVYLVVLAAPTVHRNYNWEPGFPRIYRYPYQFRLVGAVPDGFQDDFRAPPATGGSRHSNGGGYVANTATVAASAYVGLNAQVLNRARVEDNARIEDHAIIRDNARVYGNAVAKDMALIGSDAQVYGSAIVEKQARVFDRCHIYDNSLITDNAALFSVRVFGNAVVRENAMPWGGSISGTAIVGGDCEHHMDNLTSGTYLQVIGAGGNNRNEYVNAPYTEFPQRQMRHSTSLAYNLVPFSAGDIIDAVKYDFGGRGVSYFADITEGRGEPAIREFFGITGNSNSGYHIADIRAGDWLNYTINASESGSHKVVLRINSSTDNGIVKITTSQGEFTRNLKNTSGNWDTLQVLVDLGQTEEVLTIGFESTSQNYLLSFDFFSVQEHTTSTVAMTPFSEIGYRITVAPTPSVNIHSTNIIYATLPGNSYVELYSSNQELLARKSLLETSGAINLAWLVNETNLRNGMYFIALKNNNSQIKAIEKIILIK